MEPWLIAVLIKPFLLLAFLGLIVLPLKLIFQRYFPEGKIKRVLLREIRGTSRP